MCVAPNNVPCQTWRAVAVPLAAIQLIPVSGTSQAVAVGASYGSVAVRVTDQSQPPNPVVGATVLFQSLVGRAPNGEPILWIEQTGISQPTIPVILAQSQTTVLSDGNGIASIQPTTGGIDGPVVVLGEANAGASTVDFQLQSLLQVIISSPLGAAQKRAFETGPDDHINVR